MNLLTTSYNAASVNKGWIWSANAALTPTQELFRLYQQSRGKGWPFLLNVGPDQTGRIPEPCAGVLMQMKKLIGGEAAASRGFYASLRSVAGVKALIENSPQP